MRRGLCLLPVLLLWNAASAAVDVNEQFTQAQTHLQRGRTEEALEIYDALTKAEADPVKIALGRSRCLEVQGDWKEATEVLAAASKKAEKQPSLWARLAELQLAQGQFAAANTSVERALKFDESLPLGRLVQADLLTATGHLKEANEQYRWFVRLYNQKQPDDPETLLLIARGSAQYARWNNVADIFEFVVNTLAPDILAKDKDRWEAYFLSGSLLLEKYNRAEGLPEFKKALTVNPRAAEVYAALGQAAVNESNLAEAEQSADRALEINPHLPAALHVKADLKLDAGNTKEALEFLQRALAVNPHDELTLARVATCYLLDDGPPPEAELKELLSNLDDIGDAKIDNPSRFTALTMDLAKRNPHPGLFLTLLAKSLESRRQFELAERFFKQAILAMPQLSEPKSELGMLYMRIGKNDEARKILDAAFDADPYHVRVSNMRKVLNVLEGYEAITTDHFVIRVDSKADKILGKYMAEYLEEQYPGLVKQFGFEPATRTQFEIYNNAKGLSAHQWFSARMVGLPWIQTVGASTGMIVALSSPTAAEKPFNWARVLKHEFVHILTLQQTQFNIPHWYTEALAVLNEGYARPETWNQLLLERVPKGDLMNLDNINLGFIRPKTPLDWQMAYCQSLLYAQYMIEKFGPEKTSQLLDAYRQHLNTEQAIPKVFGIEKAEFEKGYREYLNHLVADLRGQGETAMTLAQAEKAHLAKPEDPHASARYAYELMKAGKRKQARPLAVQALKQEPAEPYAALVMAQLELRSEDAASAITYLEAALDRESPHPKVLLLLAQLKLQEKQFAAAAELYEIGLKQQPENVELLKGLAAAYLKNKNTEKLKAVLVKLVGIDPDDAPIRKKLAHMALDEKNYVDAIHYGQLALHVDVLDVETHRILAEAYAALKQPDKAARELSVAAEIKTDDLDLAVEAAKAEAAAGNNAAAAKRLQQILKTKPDLKSAKELLEQIQK